MQRDISYLPTVMHAIHKKMMLAHETILEENKLGKRHIGFIIVIVENNDGLTQNEICQKLRLDKGHVSRTLRDLESKGFVQKKGDGTYKHVYIATKKALEVRKQFKKTNQTILSKMFDILSKEEFETLEKILKKLMTAL